MDSVLHYEIVEKLGEGGMGVVYKARDTRLQRFVALKFLPPGIGPDDEERARFLQEARAASALDHPNICTIHDIERAPDGRSFIVMACYEGETLRARLQRGPLPVADAVSIGRQIAQGVGRAHERGIVHRDVKPANVFLTSDGPVKVLDFGIARLVDETHVQITREGTTIGTVAYMSPEQARGEPVDRRADVWAIGVILHEMLTGRPAFEGQHDSVILQAIQTREPAPIARPDAPVALVSLVSRALKKRASERFADAAALAEALADVEKNLTASPPPPAVSVLRRPAVAIALTSAVLVLVATIGWLWYTSSRANWARNQALPAIAAMAAERRYDDAAALAEEAQQYLPGDPVLAKLWTDIAVTLTIESTPPGAAVEIRPYADQSAAWRSLGQTPLGQLRVPRGTYRWRFSRPGSETIERAAAATAGTLRVDLPPAGSVPPDSVRIAKAAEVMMLAGYGLPQELILDDYFIQRHEVTNRDYKKFVDGGGYRRQELWRHEFTERGRTLAWEDAMARFRDKAGQPGPATWEVGAYPDGQDDLPVAGVSWYEAAAYAEFAGASLPTIPQWFRAAGMTAGPFLIPEANFDYRGPRPVGHGGAMSPSGAFDMAGNVKEWVWNANTSGDRYILGGGWGEPPYMFGDLEARSPFDRAPTNGIRCVKYPAGGGPDPKTTAPFARTARDYSREAPVSDEMFAQFLRMQQYAPSPLEAVVEKRIDGGMAKVERVTFKAAYGGERVIAYLWLPKDRPPPYQTIVVFPGAEALRPAGPDVLEQPDRYDFLVRSGRAVVHPVYHGMYERFVPRDTTSIGFRDASIRWSQDARRTVDYLLTRNDIDGTRIAYFGASLGAGFSPMILSHEPRFRIALLMGGGLLSRRMEPEMEPVNHLPRVKQPLLLVTGRYDYFIPYDPAQKTFFQLIGTPAEHKRHVVIEAAHAVPRADYLPEVLGWLDKYFGPAR